MLIEAPLTSLRDRLLLVRSLPSFRGLDEEGLTLLAEHAATRLFRAGESVLVEGAPIAAIYLVVSGQITSHRLGRRLAVVTRSHGVGFLSVVARDENGVSAVADEDTHTLEIPTEAIHGALEENFSMLRNTLLLCARGLLKKRGPLPRPTSSAAPLVMGEPSARPWTLVELVLQLRAESLFSTCNLDAVFAVARHMREIRVDPGAVLWRIGEPSSFWLRVDSGAVRCTSSDGQTVDVGRGFVLGIIDAFAQTQRTYEARAETAVTAYRTDIDAYLTVLESHFDLASDVLARVGRSVLETP